MRTLPVVILCIAAVCATTPLAVFSQAFPSKPVRLVVPFPPGGVDVTMRQAQNPMAEDLGQPIVIENRPGANGMIGAEIVARSAPDGYTVLAMPVGLVTGAAVTTAPVDPIKDFTPITMVIMSWGILVAKPSLPLNSLKELIDHARRNPGKISYASTGIGSEQHLAGEILKLSAGVDLNHIPYKGFGPVTQAILGGEVDLALFTVEIARPLVTSGKAKPIAVFLLNKRHPALPNVPDVAELVPSFHTTRSWIGLFGPAGLSRPVVARLNAAAVKALNAPAVRSRLEENGAMVVANTADEFAAMIKSESATAAKVVKELKARGVRFE